MMTLFEHLVNKFPVAMSVRMLDPLIEKGPPNTISSSVVETLFPDSSKNNPSREVGPLVNARSNENQNEGHFWDSYATMPAEEFTQKLLEVVARIDWKSLVPTS